MSPSACDLHLKSLDGIEKRLDRMETKLDALQEFKWKAIGGAAAIAAIISMLGILIK